MRDPDAVRWYNAMGAGQLTIQITKRSGKPALLECTRAGGSVTMAEVAPGPAHDLAHYAVETTLGLKQGFFGLLAAGWDIADFDVAGAAKRLSIPPEAVAVEHVVNLLTMELLGGAYESFEAELARALAAGRRPVEATFTLASGQVAAMRARLAELLGRWRALPPGGTLELAFPGAQGS